MNDAPDRPRTPMASETMRGDLHRDDCASIATAPSPHSPLCNCVLCSRTREKLHRGRASGVAGCNCRSCAIARAVWGDPSRKDLSALIETSAGASLDYIGRLCGIDRARRTDSQYRAALLNYIRTGSTAPVGDALDKLGELVHFDKPAPEGEVRISFPNTPEPALGDYTAQELRRTAQRAREREAAYARTHVHGGDNRSAALVERDIACPTCRRVFCRARVSEGAVVEPVCAGCIAEGRT